MSEYLDRKQVIDLYEKFHPSLATHVYEFGEALRKLPVTQDSHGEWIEHKWAEEVEGILISNYECSSCHSWKRENTDFCPDCGSDNRQKEGEAE